MVILFFLWLEACNAITREVMSLGEGPVSGCMGDRCTVCRWHQHRHSTFTNQRGGMAGQFNSSESRPAERFGVRHPHDAVTIPYRNPPWFCERHGAGLHDDPDHHQRTDGRQDSRPKRRRNDHAAAIRGQLWFHIAG